MPIWRNVPVTADQLSALASVVIIDVVLAGDNAVVVGLAAAALPPGQRRPVLVLGIAAATLLRILFAFFAASLLEIIGLTLAGGLLLLWVAWKLYREIRGRKAAATGEPAPIRRRRAAPVLARIVLADASMSLDNTLAVAGTARSHLLVLAFGLLLSVALMAVASGFVARLLDRHFWLSWLGLGIVTFVALRLIWDGTAEMLGPAGLMRLFG
jgi:YjbE family integral membrane protein